MKYLIFLTVLVLVSCEHVCYVCDAVDESGGIVKRCIGGAFEDHEGCKEFSEKQAEKFNAKVECYYSCLGNCY